MSNRRDFLKKALLVVAASTAAPELIAQTWVDITEHPEVKAILGGFPEKLQDHEKQVIAKFILKELENGNWHAYDDVFVFFHSSEANSKHNWKAHDHSGS